MRHRNSYVWEQVMQRRIKNILADQKKHPENYLDFGKHISTTTQATGSLTLEDLQRTITSIKDEMRAGEQQAFYESLYRPEIVRTPWRMPLGGVL